MEAKKRALYTDVVAVLLVLLFITGVGGYLLYNVLRNSQLTEKDNTSWSIHVSWDLGDLKNLTDQFNQLQSGDPSAWGKKHEVKAIRMFAAGRDIPAVKERKYNNQFAQQDVQYIYTEINYYNAFYKLKDGEINIVVQYYNSDGSLLAENKRTAHPKKNWASALFVDKYGYEERGQWQPGNYTIKVFIEGDFAGEYPFEIYPNEAVKQTEML